MNNIATIIVTYNAVTNNWIYKCLDSILNSTLETDIIIIDNGSSDGTIAIIKEKYPQVRLIEAETNLGFGKANNLGIETALKIGAEYFFLLNQDAWVEPDTIEKLHKQISNVPEFGVLSPLHLTGDGSKLDWNFEMSASYKLCTGLSSDFILNKNTDKIYHSDFVCAAAWMISKLCVEKVGGFNPSFYHYGEDDNYIQRMKYNGFKVGIYPQVKMYHDRENRVFDEKFWSKDHISRNKYLLNISNPNKNLNTTDVLKHLKISYLKTYLKNNKAYRKQIKDELIYFREKKLSLEKNLQESIDSRYSFLDFDE